jgi:hypothetical protein
MIVMTKSQLWTDSRSFAVVEMISVPPKRYRVEP